MQKEENYLLNEIIEHILTTRNKSRIEWDKIRALPSRSARKFSRDYTSGCDSSSRIEQTRLKFKRCQSTGRMTINSEYKPQMILNLNDICSPTSEEQSK